MSAAMSGPAQDYGTNMKLGIEAYFERINREGGINGRKLILQALDDGYIPELAKKNMERFIADNRIIAVIGNVGTPTAKVTIPLANKNKILLFGSYTGAELLRKIPPDRYIINYRASYAQETAILIQYLLNQGILPYEIAFFTQNDSYGEACYNSAIKAMKTHGFYNYNLNSRGIFERNTLDITDAIIAVLDGPVKPRAIIMAGTYWPCAKFIRIVKKNIPDAIFANVSFVGSHALANALGAEGKGVVITQVVPNFDLDLPLTKDYLADLKRIAPYSSPSYISLEGYIVAKIFVHGLKLAGNDINRESIIDGILNIQNLDIGMDKKISFDKNKHQGSEHVWLTIIGEHGFECLEIKAK
ncbi:MAG: ABC transporter substrate-binding protein [Bacteroidales bacterium]|nr:ABC transporter substrate-binding protein [Bacteroidales bacterium]